MNAMVQHFHFEPGTLIAYDGYEVVVSGSVKTGIVVRDLFVGEGEAPRYFVITDHAVQELLTRNDVVIDDTFNIDHPNLSEHVSKEARFEDLSEQVQRTAYQRESWCLAAQAVLKKGPYTEARIKSSYSVIRKRALERQELNAVGAASGNGEFPARTWKAKAVSNFCKAYFSTSEPHPRALVSRPPGGNGTRD